MASDPTRPPAKSGMVSLYANLLDPSVDSSGPGTISRAPVVFKQPGAEDNPQDGSSSKKPSLNNAALRFQPTRRPQLQAQKAKGRPSLMKSQLPPANNAGVAKTSNSNESTPVRPPTMSTLADWAAAGDDDDDVNGFYARDPRQRGGRKKRKKNKDDPMMAQNWDDIYDPSRPNSYDLYKDSDEKIREVQEWKDRLYAHKIQRRHSSDLESEDEYGSGNRYTNQFAPPSSYSFAPPTFDDTSNEPPPPPPAEVPDDATGDDAYTRRLRMSTMQQQPAPPAYEPPSLDQQVAPPTETEPASGTISRAPVRYEVPAPEPAEEALDADMDREEEQENGGQEEDEPRSLRPGQKGFAERLMAKQGWTKGSGLGATGSGIINPLQVKIEKRRKRPDSEGGGYVDVGGRGRIIGGKKGPGANADRDEGKFGAMSEVVVLRNMLGGIDLDTELEDHGDGGLMQEIGEECGEKYGRVERVFINREELTVFLKFTSQLSALRAVNDLEGRIFNGNTIAARFFNTEKFEKGIYT
ncbi:hypothetical protein L228DRAFT_266135 [Xylona heveae TC161]|uniref:G-patch domain-containing protein n=1 Tax=Xylona heveae (strain CBS 132557 / TC161) TaxID=1328760 RepID=A0A161THE9_XYLHT|nr:hypothetical protein L228DRAFT_266135 [Xylona heveae TC161]KZF25677.1 hypothetical protein L228DRAFT_266135 [Xylona heveae TC161]